MNTAETVIVTLLGKDQLSPVINTTQTKLNQLGSKGVNDVNRLGESFNKFRSNLSNLNQGLTSMLSMLGFGTVLTESLENAGMRQTNKVYLGLKKGTEEAQRLYDKIQATVVALPGDDKFMTNILSMITATDKSIGEAEIGDIGTVIANYTAAAKAKGQDAYETEKEIRNYIMAGETRNLTNSVLATEIDLLKNKNTTMERVNALQKAMEKTGYDQLATIPTYVNMMEQFKGRLEKGFADLGDLFLPIVQGAINLYNIVDDLTNSGLTVFLLGSIGLFSLLTTVVTGTGFAIKLLINSASNLISTFQAVISVVSGIKEAGSILTYLDTVLGSMASTRLEASLWAEYTARMGVSQATLNEIAMKHQLTVAELMENTEREVELDLMYAQILATTGLTESKLNEILSIKGNTIETIYETYAIENEIGAKKSASLWSMITSGNLKKEVAERVANVLTTLDGTAVKWLDVDATIAASEANILWSTTIDGVTVSLTVATAGLILIPIAIMAIVFAIYKLGEAFGVWKWLADTVNRLWEAFANSEPIKAIIDYFQDFAYTIETFFGSVFTIIGAVFGDMSGEGTDAVGILINIFGALGDVVMFVWNIFDAWSNSPLGIITWLNPLGILIFHLDELGQVIWWVMSQWNKFVDSAEYQSLVDAFEEIQSAFGEVWTELVDAFDIIKEAFGEVWVAMFGESSGVIGENSDLILDALKLITGFITTVVVPVIKVFAFHLKMIASIIKGIAEVIAWFIGFFVDPLSYIGNLGDMIVNEFLNIPSRISGAVLGIPEKVFGGLVDGVLGILGINSPGYIQEAVVNEFLNIPLRILGGIGNIVGAVGSFASAIWSGFDSIFGTNVQGIVDGFFNGLDKGFDRLSKGDIIGAVKAFGDDFLNTFDSIFGTDVSGMVDGFFNQISSNFNKLLNGDIVGVLGDTGNWFNDSVKRFTGIDIGSLLNGESFGLDMNIAHSQLESQVNLMNDPSSWQTLSSNPQSLTTQQNLAQTYNHQNTNQSMIINNNFGEGSVPIDARNMTQDEAQKMFIGAFGYNKVKGVGGFL